MARTMICCLLLLTLSGCLGRPSEVPDPRGSHLSPARAVSPLPASPAWKLEPVLTLQDPAHTWIHGLAFLPGGRKLVSAGGQNIVQGSTGGSVRLWDLTTGSLLRTFRGHKGPFNDVAFTPDARMLVTGNSDGTVTVWEIATGKLKTTLRGDVDEVNTVAISPDGKTLATGGADNTVRLWDTTTWRRKRVLQGDADPTAPQHPPLRLSISSIAFSPDGRWLAEAHAVTYGGEPMRPRDYIALWNARTWKVERIFAYEGQIFDEIEELAFSPDSRYLAASYSAAGQSGYVALWDVSTGGVRTIADDEETPWYAMSFALRGQAIAVAGPVRPKVALWDTTTGKQIGAYRSSSEFTIVAASPDGKGVAAGDEHGTITLLRLMPAE
jgi:WD40 repeat protein